MVKLTKIYTKSGDDGWTMLGDGKRVAKTHPRVIAYGTVDEANATIGVAAAACGDLADIGADLVALLRRVQNELFDVGADLCTPIASEEEHGKRLRVQESQTLGLEAAIDAYNAKLEPLSSFVLPGGSAASAALHVARTTVRRAERFSVQLAESEPDTVNAEAVRYLNRLSDLLFVLARVANDWGNDDLLWKPGGTREDGGERG